MFRRTRFTGIEILALIFILSLTAGGVGFGFGSWVVESKREHNTSQKHANYAEERINAECSHIAVVPERHKCEAEIVQTAQENSYAEDDLDAQTDMAVWALLMMVTSVFSVGVTGLGVIYVARTLNQTVRANKTALLSAKVASRSVIAAREANAIIRDGQRPWLTLDPMPGCSLTGHEGRAHIAYNFRVINKGRMPAHSVRTYDKVVSAKNHSELKSRINECILDWNLKTRTHTTFRTIFPNEKDAGFESWDTPGDMPLDHDLRYYLILYVGYWLDQKRNTEPGAQICIYHIAENTGGNDSLIAYSHILNEHEHMRQTT